MTPAETMSQAARLMREQAGTPGPWDDPAVAEAVAALMDLHAGWGVGGLYPPQALHLARVYLDTAQ
jgi:hypothetical protein